MKQSQSVLAGHIFVTQAVLCIFMMRGLLQDVPPHMAVEV